MSNSANNRFVILHHQIPAGLDQESSEHWDLMLEDSGKLLTWALQNQPEAGKAIAARQLENHRMKYLDYEGQISGDRGSVSRFLRGSFAWLKKDAECIKVELRDSGQFNTIEIIHRREQVTCKFT